ncbi:hypothetical protein AGDE_09956 [Angomonas deanei]|uniref:Uncharacterized protein n=1 Tax=Angomonas deanei TaxID=59799 RepID=A0A7G2CEZ3_9TRYP|nr:hypothetical protein AGDE_09956 [Angomonas deanei]CAD2216692.1 hypothetical protein, conserved [Angomonas deanei]|eukprot:EPY29437.1 hypothetical protein AGDE_09956 [Angomonas deanei]
MPFGDIDRDEPTLAERVQRAKVDILKGHTVETDWKCLVDSHVMLKDVARDAKMRGELFANVLCALELIADVLRTSEKTEDEAPNQETALVGLASDLFSSLYTVSPIPSRKQWKEALLRLSPEEQMLVVREPTPAWAKAAADTVREGDLDADEDDDGSFVEEELKALVKRCIVLGRRCKRSVPNDSSKSQPLSEAINILTSYVNDGALEW